MSLKLADFRLERVLSESKRKEVCIYLCRRNENRQVVLKVLALHQEDVSPVARNEMEREVAIHSTVSHPSILPSLGSFSEGDRLILILEPALENLYDYLQRVGPMSESLAVSQVAVPLLDALTYLHDQRGVIHRDIKPENVLMMPDGRFVLADFGLSVDVKRERAVTRVGTTGFMAPELTTRAARKRLPTDLKDDYSLGYDESIDIFSFGWLVIELVLGAVADSVVAPPRTAEGAPTRYLLDRLSPVCADFVQRCTSTDPAERWTAADLLKHRWIRQFQGDPSAAAFESVRMSSGYLNASDRLSDASDSTAVDSGIEPPPSPCAPSSVDGRSPPLATQAPSGRVRSLPPVPPPGKAVAQKKAPLAPPQSPSSRGPAPEPLQVDPIVVIPLDPWGGHGPDQVPLPVVPLPSDNGWAWGRSRAAAAAAAAGPVPGTVSAPLKHGAPASPSPVEPSSSRGSRASGPDAEPHPECPVTPAGPQDHPKDLLRRLSSLSNAFAFRRPGVPEAPNTAPAPSSKSGPLSLRALLNMLTLQGGADDRPQAAGPGPITPPRPAAGPVVQGMYMGAGGPTPSMFVPSPPLLDPRSDAEADAEAQASRGIWADLFRWGNTAVALTAERESPGPRPRELVAELDAATVAHAVHGLN